MDKKQALKILIEQSYLLDEVQKQQLMHRFDKLNKDEIEKLGKILAAEKKNSLELAQQKIDGLDKVINELDEYIKKNST